MGPLRLRTADGTVSGQARPQFFCPQYTAGSQGCWVIRGLPPSSVPAPSRRPLHRASPDALFMLQRSALSIRPVPLGGVARSLWQVRPVCSLLLRWPRVLVPQESTGLPHPEVGGGSSALPAPYRLSPSPLRTHPSTCQDSVPCPVGLAAARPSAAGSYGLRPALSSTDGSLGELACHSQRGDRNLLWPRACLASCASLKGWPRHPTLSPGPQATSPDPGCREGSPLVTWCM